MLQGPAVFGAAASLLLLLYLDVFQFLVVVRTQAVSLLGAEGVPGFPTRSATAGGVVGSCRAQARRVHPMVEGDAAGGCPVMHEGVPVARPSLQVVLIHR